MTATYKKIYTKPSVSDVWFFEIGIQKSQTQFSNYIKDVSESMTAENPGFINFKIEETITLEELESRKEELKEIRPDLYRLYFEITIEDVTDSTFILAADFAKKHNIPVLMNPFSNTHIEIFEFDTWENLITAYGVLVADNDTVREITNDEATRYNNTIIEEFYIDNVKQDYIGALGN